MVLVAFCEGAKVDACIQSTIFNWKATIVLQIWKLTDSQEHVFWHQFKTWYTDS